MTDPVDPVAAASHPNPYPYYARLRDEAGVHRVDPLGLWAFVRADTVAAALAAPAARVRPPDAPVPAFLLGTPAADVFGALARMTDGAVHRAQRARTEALLQRMSSAPLDNAFDPAFDAVGARWRAAHDGAALDELVTGLPVHTVAGLLGLGSACRADVAACIDDWVRGLAPTASAARQQAAVAAMSRLRGHLATSGVQALDDVAAHVAVLMQPHEATAGLIGAGLLRWMADPARHRAATEGRLDLSRFAADVLRDDPPIQNTRRTLVADTVFGEVTVPAGATLLLVLASAAHDRPSSAGAVALQPPAEDGPSLGGGVHRCPGGGLAIAIACAAWRRLARDLDADRLRRLHPGVTWRASPNARIPVFGGTP